MTPTSARSQALDPADTVTDSPSRAARASSSRRSATLTRTGGVVAAMAVVGLAAGACSSEDSGSGNSTAGTAAGTSAAAGSGDYENGEYTAVGEYNSPGGPQTVGVTVTLSNSVITAVSIDTSQTKGPSLEYQGKFAGGISDVIVGKNIDEIEVDKVSGSSLTSGGFNEAITQIKEEAQA
ncbi:FMN-binding protein [Gordonia jinghuaiqii]|uniref:FMN-binding protein n=1 Tax=Gordonia jinghuaiqii TaxID=2758710 RepID=A0A7D7LVQ6_9ACTN|nr:FMN-binding protein [Gordonia jinghuaiqii]MCR5978421.1 FMN-binding protein [Gordonia jinghuaiqii]QMT02761.1 FMN-binding protein [Gordonia jinghuaiqii]